MKPVKVGICGLGTVGGGTFNVLQRNAEEISRRAGRGIEVAQIATRSPKPQFETTGIAITNDVFAVATNPEIDIVIELVGGYTVARELVLKAIENGKYVVTANKVLIDIDATPTIGRLYVVGRALQLAERKATEAERQRADAIVCREWNRTVVRECLMPGSPTERFVSCVLTAIRSKQEGEGA